MAAFAAIPDLYLQSNETWTVAGGISGYDDGYGGVEYGFGGGVQFRSSAQDNWSLGASLGTAQDSVSFRIQGRIGG